MIRSFKSVENLRSRERLARLEAKVRYGYSDGQLEIV